MNIIELVKDILLDFPKISAICNDIHVDFNSDIPTDYGLSSTGDTLISEDVIGGQIRQHNLILYAVYQSLNDYDRMNNSGTLLELQMWLEHNANEQAVSITAGTTTYTGKLTNLTCANGMLYNIPNENTNDAVQYQLQISAQYSIGG